MKKTLSILSLCVATLLGGALLKGCGEEGEGQIETVTYNIALPDGSDVYTISSDKTTAAEDETVTLTVQLVNSVDYSIDAVRYNNSSCTKVDETTYTFVMPASDVEITVDTTHYEEVLSNNNASFRSPMPNKVAKAQESDASWARDSFYIDFAETVVNPNVTIISSNEDVVPTSAVTEYSRSGDGSFVDAIYYRIALSDVELGTCYLTFNISSTTTGYSATLVKKLEVVEYGADLYDTIWTENVTVELTSLGSLTLDDLTIQVYDTNRQYSSSVGTAQTETPTSYEHTITFSYVPEHTYYLAVYYRDEGGSPQYLSLTDAYSGGSSLTGYNQCVDGYLTFIEDGVTLTVRAEPK